VPLHGQRHASEMQPTTPWLGLKMSCTSPISQVSDRGVVRFHLDHTGPLPAVYLAHLRLDPALGYGNLSSAKLATWSEMG